MKKSISTVILPLFVSIFLSPQAYAYLSLAESGELAPEGKYQVGGEAQFLTNRGGGANLNIFLDTRLNESMSGRLSMGGGGVDFNAFASAKWVPFPDVDNQPAMGVRVGAGIARDEDLNIVQLQVAPLASKRYTTDLGLMVPYVAVPFTFINTKEENYVASNIVFGTEFTHPEFEYGFFGAEIGAELNKSYTYISVFATFPFDGQNGFGK